MKTTFTPATFTPLIRLLFIAMALVSALTGCGGGGGGGTPATYTVGGTASGLSNTGLVLQNNASDDLSISADGSFTFNTSLNTNTAYAITIKTQPIGQTCTVTNGTGTVTTTNINTASVSCVLDQQDAQGLYNGAGSATFNGTAVPLNDVKGMIYGSLPKQKFIFFDIASNVLYEGTITSITLTDFIGTAIVYHDGLKVDNKVSVSGTVTSQSQIDMSLTANTPGGVFGVGSVKGLFSTKYNEAATATRVSRLPSSDQPWQSAIYGSAKTAVPKMQANSLTINADGSYNKTAQGINLVAVPPPSLIDCKVQGQLQVGAPKNIYIITDESVSDSGGCLLLLASNYAGFASVVAVNASDQGTKMWYAITNGLQSIFVILDRAL